MASSLPLLLVIVLVDTSMSVDCSGDYVRGSLKSPLIIIYFYTHTIVILPSMHQTQES